MQGIIFLWFGSILEIPPGWALCDGTQGTPDLKSYFVLGAGLTYDPDDESFYWSHQHLFTGGGHDHTVLLNGEIQSGDDVSKITSAGPAAGLTGYTHAWPPYYALCYIMKLP